MEFLKFDEKWQIQERKPSGFCENKYLPPPKSYLVSPLPIYVEILSEIFIIYFQKI
jgi:hypothetical protein